MAYQALILHKDNPFRESLEARIASSEKGILINEEYTVTRKRQYIKGPGWIRLTQDKEMLSGLDPWGWAIIGYMALHIEPNQETIKLSAEIVGMDRRKFNSTMVDLLLRRVLVKGKKRSWYWINVGLLIFGTINKHEP